MPIQLTAPTLPQDDAAPAFAAVYREHHGFVARTLRHLGVDPGRVDDAVQDTFLVVHRRLAEFEGRAALRTWLFEIARRVAGRYRRTAAREAPRCCPLDDQVGDPHQDDELARAEAAELLRVFLDELDRDKSVVFILSELEQWRAPEIAEALELNLNTVYARLRAARKQLDRVVARVQARERRPRVRRGVDVVAAALLAVPPDALRPPDLYPWPAAAPLTSKLVAAATSTTAWLSGLAVAAAVAAFALRPAAPPADPPPTRLVTHESPPTPAPRPAAPIATPPAPPVEPPTPARPTSSFAAELASLEAARAALLAGDGPRALQLLTRHQRRFATGELAREAAVTRLDVLCQLGDLEAARREHEHLIRRWPDTLASPCR